MRIQAQSQIDYSALDLSAKKKDGINGMQIGGNFTDQKARGRSQLDRY